jgi:iron complex transport system permease protein
VSAHDLEVPAGRWLLGHGPVQVLVHRRTVLATLLLVPSLVSMCVVHLASGQVAIPLTDVGRALLFGTAIPGEVVLEVLRLPRLLVGVAAGLAFGMSGALIQAVARNPLASPDVIGVTHGASAAVVAVFTFGLAATAPIQAAALAGGMLAALLVYLLAWRGGLNPARFLLIGIGIAAGLSALTRLLLTRGDFILAEQAKVWTVGTLNGLGYESSVPLALSLVALLPALVWAGRRLPDAAFDDDTVTALGGRPQVLRGLLALLGIVLAALATAAVGPVHFVALLAPQVARLMVARPTAPLLASALVGGLIVVVADTLGRNLFLPIEVPAGVLTAIVGAPYLLWLILRRDGGSL